MRLTTIARGGLLAFVGLVALEHPLRLDDLPPGRHFISEYAHGSTAPLAIGAFLAWGAAMAATAVLARRERLRVVPALLAVAAAGTVVCAAFATQTVGGELPRGVARTTGGRLHDQGTLLIFVGLLGSALWGLRNRRTRSYRRGLAACAAALVLAPGILVAAGLDWPGVGQRAIILVGVAWQWLWLSSAAPAQERATRARRTPAPARG